MKKALCVSVSMVFFFCAFISAADFKPYPGSKEDAKATKEARDAAVAAGMADARITIYTTSDSFEKVAGFYKGIGKEYSMPRASGTSGTPKKRPGYDLWEAYFIFDGANDLAASKVWIKVQRPYIGSISGGKVKMEGRGVPALPTPKSEDVRDVTAIVLTQKT